METIHNIIDVLKMIGVIFIPIIGYYAKSIASSIKSMEQDISGIKTHIEISKVEKVSLENRVIKLEIYKDDLEKERFTFWKKYSHALNKIAEQNVEH